MTRRIWSDCRGAAEEVWLMMMIHDITKIDKWFIDKLAIIVEMETALKTQELTRRTS